MKIGVKARVLALVTPHFAESDLAAISPHPISLNRIMSNFNGIIIWMGFQVNIWFGN